MDKCGICMKHVPQLFETSKEGVYACFKCQPLVPEVSLGDDHQAVQQVIEIPMDSMEDVMSNTSNENTSEGTKTDLVCELCNKTFERNVQLQNHLRNHRAERRFLCMYCNKAFSQSNNLRAHLRIHTNERPYKCHVCDKAFTQVTNLNNHLRLHTGERPFVCDVPGCGKAYAQVTNLNQHRKRHLSGRALENAYMCNVCGEQFEQRNHMYDHRRQAHAEFKSVTSPKVTSHSCKLCDATFPSERKLMMHVAEHVNVTQANTREQEDNDPRYKCVFSSCGSRFGSTSEHTEHLLRAHQLKVLTVPDAAARSPRRGRPPKGLQPTDPLDLKGTVCYEVEVEQIKQESQFYPKLKVQNLFQ